jgi:hypothetical protein
MHSQVRLILLASAAFFFGLLSAHASTIPIGAARTFTTLAAGMAAASNGDTLLIDDGIYAGGLTVTKSLTFQAVNIGGAIVEGGGGIGDAVFTLGPAVNSTFFGLTVRNASRGYFQRDTGAHGLIEYSLIYGVTTGIDLNNSGGTAGSFDVFNSTFSGFSIAIDINDGGTINVTNSILAGATGSSAYVATDFNFINPDHNLLFNVATVALNTPLGHFGTITADPAQIIGDPLFVNAAGGDFRLMAGSPAIDSGKNIGFAFNGAAPDRGAFETVPEPSSITLLGLGGLLGFSGYRRRLQRGR